MGEAAVHTHPEIERFRRDFNTEWVPDGVEFQIDRESIRGERRNTDWSRLGLTVGAFVALGLCGVGFIYIPVINVTWGLMMLSLVLIAPYLGARAALFRYRKGRKKTFELDLSGDEPRWQSNDDLFWAPVRAFFKV